MKQLSPIAVLFGAGIAGFCWWTYSGPYRWLAEWEINSFGHYYRFYTFLLLAMAISAGADQVVRVVRRSIGHGDDSSMPAWWRALEAQTPQFFQMLTGGVILLVLGAYSAWSSSSAERAGLCRIPLSRLESGQERTSDWVQVTGTLLWEDCWGWKDGAAEVYYVPVVSADWRPGDPATAFARFTEAEAQAASDFETVQGMVEQTGMPGPIEAGFEDDGPPPADAAFVVNVNETPSSRRMLHFVVMLFGLGMAVGSLLVYKPRPDFVDLDVALEPDEPNEPADPRPAETRRGSATTLTDWTPRDESAQAATTRSRSGSRRTTCRTGRSPLRRPNGTGATSSRAPWIKRPDRSHSSVLNVRSPASPKPGTMKLRSFNPGSTAHT